MHKTWSDFLTPILPADWALPDQHPFRMRNAGGEIAWHAVASETHGNIRTDTFDAPSGLRLVCRSERFPAEQALVVKLTLTNSSDAPAAPLNWIEPLRLRITTAAAPGVGRTIGGGGNYVDSRTASSTLPLDPTTGLVKQVPGYFVLNAMGSYHLSEQLALQVNVFNLANRSYIDEIHPSHVVPGAGTSALDAGSRPV